MNAQSHWCHAYSWYTSEGSQVSLGEKKIPWTTALAAPIVPQNRVTLQQHFIRNSIFSYQWHPENESGRWIKKKSSYNIMFSVSYLWFECCNSKQADDCSTLSCWLKVYYLFHAILSKHNTVRLKILHNLIKSNAIPLASTLLGINRPVHHLGKCPHACGLARLTIVP